MHKDRCRWLCILCLFMALLAIPKCSGSGKVLQEDLAVLLVFGAEYKKDRKILLQNLSGSAAFRDGKKSHEEA